MRAECGESNSVLHRLDLFLPLPAGVGGGGDMPAVLHLFLSVSFLLSRRSLEFLEFYRTMS